jgi:fucose 4-O-acetylase-like acetyltransferase
VSAVDAVEVARISRTVYADNLKVVLVSGVVVAHVTMAWTALQGAWVFSEPAVREPVLTVLRLATIVGALVGMPLFFLVAGVFTPRSLQRKGLHRYAVDRTLRLLVPSLLFVLVLTPPIEYLDPDAADWAGGFWAFFPHVWTLWPPAPGPTWFLGVLLAFSLLYGVARTLRPRPTSHPQPLRARQLVAVALAIALASYSLRIAVPMGHEVWHLALGQAPAWIAGFTLGVLGGERGWYRPIEARLARSVRRVGWAAMALCVVFVAAVASTSELDVLFGGGSWQSLMLATLEGIIVVTVSLWLIDLFQRRFDHQGRIGAAMSRAAFAAFLVHQAVLVALVLASRHVASPPELKYLAVASLGVAMSFALGALLVRVPGLSRLV